MDASYHLTKNADLTAHNTFGVPACAPLLVEVADAAALPELFDRPGLRDAPMLVLGGGSNLLFAGDPQAPVLALGGQCIDIVEADGTRAVIRADAGVTWHALVMWTLARGYSGLENLALIPGSVGAAPIQNIGAYGVEVGDAIHLVEAFEPATGQWHHFDRDACEFAYRDSRFKREPERYIVTAVEFALARDTPVHLDYAGLREELVAMGIDGAPQASQVAKAVIRIRQRKLPDPEVIGNAGSFFKNPIVTAAQAQALKAEHSALPVFPLAPFPADAALHGEAGDAVRCKLSAAWLIEACGWKGHRDGDAGVSESHALVLVNHGNATGTQLLDLARRIAVSVHERFGIALEPEPRIIGAQW